MNNSYNSKKFDLKKCFICLLLALIMILSPIMLSGCMKDGKNGAQGPQGEQGVQGPAGGKGDDGPKGDDGVSTYLGYDGYIWNGAERTDYNFPDATVGDEVFEHTLEVTGVMSKYFAHKYIDLSKNRIALMPYYKKNAKVTIFSSMEATEITVFAEQDGNLEIGTAQVEKIVEARTNGTSLNVSNTTSYQLKQGKNVITFATPLVVGENETIVLGGNGSVALYVAQNIPVNDEAGNFTLIDGQTHSNVIENSVNEYADTLAIQVKVKLQGDSPIFENLEENIKQDFGSLAQICHYQAQKGGEGPDSSSMVDHFSTGDEYWGAYLYPNEKIFAGKTITKIRVPVLYLEQTGNRCYLDLYKVKAYNSPKDEKAIADRTSTDFLNNHRLTNPTPLELTNEQFLAARADLEANGEHFKRPDPDKYEYFTSLPEDLYLGWVEFNCHIEVGADETLAFCGSAGGVDWIFLNTALNTNTLKGYQEKPEYYNQMNIIGCVGKNQNPAVYSGNIERTQYMFFDIYYEATWSKEQQIERINKLEYDSSSAERYETLKTTLASKGIKYVSILGDSISTYGGYSNEWDTQNSEIKNNATWGENTSDHNHFGNKQFYFNDENGLFDDGYNTHTNFIEKLNVPTVNDTWWMSTINTAGLELCVNNSSAGDMVTSPLATKRSGQLHDNIHQDVKRPDQQEDINPDIVAIYMGINDFNSGSNIEPQAFGEAYKKLLQGILDKYGKSENFTIFVLTLQPCNFGDSTLAQNSEPQYSTNLELYNAEIRKLASSMDKVELVDIYKDCGWTKDTITSYANDGLHPNKLGMERIAKSFKEALYKTYVLAE